MSTKNTNQDIINFINNNYNKTDIKKEIEDEINDIVNNLDNGTCSYEFQESNKTTIIGISTNVNKSIIDLSYLVPNLFRKCFYKSKLQIPSVCPKYISGNVVKYFFPYLLEEDLIKSFLYFNFPSSYIYRNEINKNISTIKNINQLYNKNHVENYGQITRSIDLLNSIYSPNSMLIQLIRFQNYTAIANAAQNEDKIISSFSIKWDITVSCICFTNNPDDSYILVNNTNQQNNIESVIDPYTANNIFDIRLSSVNSFSRSNTVNNSGNIILFSENIYTILNYASEVYRDILVEIDYLKFGKKYCKKPYMSVLNIPILLQLYEIFYNNQLYAVSKDLPKQSPEIVVPITITLNEYMTDFINIMLKTYGTTITYLKSLVLNINLDGFVFFLNMSYQDMINTTIDKNTESYSFIYINILNPSPVTYINYLYRIPAFNGRLYSSGIVEKLVIDFNNGFSSPFGTTWVGYLTYNNVSYTTYKKYINGGLYKNFGIDPTSCSAYLYNYYNSSSKLISQVFITICSGYISGSQKGFPLAIELFYN